MIIPPRAHEALRWASEGKTNWEIGQIMGISKHGADKNIRVACTKLDAVNRAHAVAKAMRVGMIV